MAIKDYDFDFKKLIIMMLPIIYRQTKWVAWIFALFSKIRALHAEFVSFVNQKKDDVKWNGQTILLEQLLITKYGAGIYITTQVNDVFPFYVYTVNNGLNPYIYGVNNEDNPVLYPPNSYNLEQVSFIVHVPSGITFNQDEMTALINQYKLYGTSFTIEIF